MFERAHLGPDGRQHNPSSVRDLLLREPVGHQPKHLEKVTSDLAEGSARTLHLSNVRLSTAIGRVYPSTNQGESSPANQHSL